MYKFEVWDLKGFMYIFPKEWYRGYSLTFCCSVWSQPCGCCFTWGLYIKLILCHFLLNSTLAVIRPLSDHPGFDDVVVAYSGWGGGSLARYWATTSLFQEELGTHSYFWKRIISCDFEVTSSLVNPVYIQERRWSGHASSVWYKWWIY